MATTVNEVMTHDPRTLTPESSVEEAARFMRDDDVGSLPLYPHLRSSRDLRSRSLG